MNDAIKLDTYRNLYSFGYQVVIAEKLITVYEKNMKKTKLFRCKKE